LHSSCLPLRRCSGHRCDIGVQRREAVTGRPAGSSSGRGWKGGEVEEQDLYQELRPLMFSIAYRMVGSVSEAEDIVQDSFLRFHAASSTRAEIRSPKAFLSTVTTRLSIDHLRSARARRETYVGSWLPAPLLTD